jgi:hypothetical protein
MPKNGESPGDRDVAAMSFFNGTLLLYGSLAKTALNFSTKSLFRYDLAGFEWTYLQTTGAPTPVIYMSCLARQLTSRRTQFTG